MGLLAPLALGFLPIAGLIIILYLLRLQRPETGVSSLFLWRSLLRDQEANAPWQRLNASLLLLLQLVIALGLILALARPWATTATTGGRDLLLVIDTSASMGATDGGDSGETRLAAAVRLAAARVAALPSNGSAAIITAADQARVVLPATRDPATLQRALAGLQVVPTSTDLGAALTLAAGIAAALPDPQVVVYSDGRFPDPRHTVADLPAPIEFVPVGRPSPNQAVVALDLRRDTGNLTLAAQVLNTADVTVTRRLDVDLDGVAWAGRALTLPPGAATAVTLDNLPPRTQVAHVHLAGADALAVDDDAWAVNRQAEPAPVLLVTGGNLFLQNALVLLPEVSLSRTAPADYAPMLTATLTVFDRFVPTATLPAGNLLFVDPPASSPLFQVSGVISAPVPLVPPAPAAALTPGPGPAGDPLLQYVDLSDLHVARAAHLVKPDWARVVIDSADGPLLLAGEVGGRRVAILAFDLHDSDLPLQTSFPLLMRNLVGYLQPPPAGGLTAGVAPHAVVPLTADVQDGADRVTVQGPSGAVLATYVVQPDAYTFQFDGTADPGVYVVSQWAGDREVRREGFAVNLFSADELRIAPRINPPLPRGRAVTDAAAADPARFEWWQVPAALALLALVGEWLVVHRLGLRRLGQVIAARRKGESLGHP